MAQAPKNLYKPLNVVKEENGQNSNVSDWMNTIDAFFDHDEKYTPNILHSYTNWTYHIKLYTLDEKAMTSFQKNKFIMGNDLAGIKDNLKNYEDHKYIVLESGVNKRYGIKDLNVHTISGCNPKTKTSTPSELTMTVEEPHGCTFIDTMYKAVLAQTTYPQPQCMPYFLEVSFKGYDRDGNIVDNIPYTTKTWEVVISEISFNITPEGTTYKMKMVPMSDLAYNIDTMTLNSKIDVAKDKSRTFKDVISELFKLINKNEYKNHEKPTKNDNNNAPEYRDNFVKILEKNNTDWLTFTFSNDDITQKNIGEAYDKEKAFSFEPGITIQNAISEMLYSLPSMTKQIKYGFEYKDDKSKGLNSQEIFYPYVIRLIPTVKLLGYDRNTHDYVKSINFCIKVMKASRVQNYKEETTYYGKGNTKEKNMALDQFLTLEKLNAKGQFNKRYDYLFTGKNKDVISVNLKIDNLWYGPDTSNLQKEQNGNINDPEPDSSANTNSYSADTVNNFSTNNIIQTGDNFYTGLDKKIKPTTLVNSDNSSSDDDEKNMANYVKNTIFAQVFDTAELADMKINIVGDPYWFGYLDESVSKDYEENKLDPVKTGNNYLMGEVSIFFNTKNNIVNENGTELVDCATIKGVWVVTEIDSKFSDGQFTQTLNATYNPHFRQLSKLIQGAYGEIQHTQSGRPKVEDENMLNKTVKKSYTVH